MQHIEKQIFLDRRERFFSKMQDNQLAILFASAQKVRTNDVNYKFRQDNNFWYLTGFPEYDAIAVFFKYKGEGKFWLFCREIDPEKELWDGKIIGSALAVSLYNADRAFPHCEFTEGFEKLRRDEDKGKYSKKYLFDIKELSNVYFNISDHNVLQETFSGWLRNSEFTLIDHTPLLHSLRLQKDDYEIKMIQQAVDLSVDAHIKAMQFSQSGNYEYEVAAILTYEFHRHNCDHAYPPIVASGPNAGTLHYISNESKLNTGDLLLLDAGAECSNYASDITRTFPVNGKFSEEQRAIYQLVLEMQKSGMQAIKPGIAWDVVQNQIVRVLVNGLIALKLLSGDVESQIEQKNYQEFYPHSFGHWLGLDVHDVGNYIDEKNDYIKLQEGMVLTVEPGIYINKNITGVDPKWHNISVRIEDDVVVTKNGCDVLSKNLPKEIEDIERICGNL